MSRGKELNPPAFQTGMHQNGDDGFEPRFTGRPASDIEPEALEWLWPGRFPLGKLALIAGVPGLGKSFLSLDIAARVSTGTPWPDQRDEPNETGCVLIMSAEDDWPSTIVPRLQAADADLRQIQTLELVRVFADEPDAFPRLDRDMAALGRAMEEHKPRLLIIDPISSYMGRVDTHKDSDLRGLLAPLSQMASKYKTAVIAVSHLNKKAGGNAVERIQGSIALPGAARAAWLVAADPAEPHSRLLLPIKNNLAETITGIGFEITDGRIEWHDGKITTDATTALAEASDTGQERREAAAWLRNLLADGPMRQPEVRQAADAEGFAWSTIKRAKRDIGVQAKKSGMESGWMWALDAKGTNDTPTSDSWSPSANGGPLRDSEGEGGPLGRGPAETEGAHPFATGEGGPLRNLATPDDLPVEWREEYEERAAIMEHDGNLPRAQAEANAFTDTLRLMSEHDCRKVKP